MSQNKISFIQYETESVFSEESGKLTGNFKISASDYSAMKYRKRFENKPEEIEKEFTDDNFEIINDILTENYFDVNQNYIISFTAVSYPLQIGNQLIFHPFFNIPFSNNPFKEKKREYPIDFIYPKSVIFSNKIKIPGGYLLKKLPDNKSFTTDNFLLVYNASENNGMIQVTATYQFKKAVYQADEYEKVKKYFDLIIKYLNQKIVLEKKA